LAISPDLLFEKEHYMKEAGQLIASVTSAKPLPGEQVLLPGERGDQLTQQAKDSGQIEIADVIWTELTAFVDK
jgi:LDH2 family malate/lactate/ureidoglycolate dehydrogenase